MNLLKVIKRIWQALPLSDHYRWRITVLLLEPILPLIRGSVVHTAYRREKEWHSKRVQPFHGDTFPVLPPQTKPDIFFWSVIDWRFRIQRPQHLARGLSEKGYRVFYVSTTFVNTIDPGFEVEQMDVEGRLFNIRIHLKGRPRIYSAPSAAADFQRLKSSVAVLLEWTGSCGVVSLVQHPYWAKLAQALPDSRLVYDCLDHHEGFDNSGEGIGALERKLLANADVVVTTSQWLHDFAATYNPNVSLIRNAAEFDWFSVRPNSVFRDPTGRQVIGYFGAIATWMDMELLCEVARAFPECLLLLVGADECGARKQLVEFDNVLMTGEVSYADLPSYLYGMDVCLLPFRIMPLTLATNPVKIYEYLSAGKPVVAVNLPEMAQFGSLVETATTREGFVEKVRGLLTSSDNGTLCEARREYAAQNTWRHRVDDFVAVIDRLPRPSASVIVLTYNNLELTRTCLESLECHTERGSFETIVVDNASTDGTQDFLHHWFEGRNDRIVILNEANRGFAAGNNQGLTVARGEYLVMLNNDTEVTQGWLSTLMNHLRRDAELGMVGPVTDNIGNEAKITLRYQGPEEMHRKARTYTLAHMGELLPMRTLAFFCIMIPRKVYERVGPLDEGYGLGFFEDDDYCRRVEQAGWKLGCAEDVFVRHHLSASFGKLGKGRRELLEHNRKIYEAKWGLWIPHRHR
jgi:GT2 family glycosyltransferase/glycosyltransferase involved in cell wall biosynthesis